MELPPRSSFTRSGRSFGADAISRWKSSSVFTGWPFSSRITSRGGIIDRFAVELQDDVPRPKSGLRGRARRHDLGHQHALRVLRSERLRELGREWLDADAEPAAGDLARGHDLRVDVTREVGGDG